MVLARLREHLELRARLAADGARVGLDDAILQPEALEDAVVGVPHLAVALHRARLVEVEAVGVLHDELATAQQARAGARLVAELHLDLIEVDGQLAVALDVAPHHVGDDLLVRRPEVILAALPVLEAHQHVAVDVPAARLLEVLGRQERRHQHLLGARRVHLLADGALDVLEHAVA